MKEEILKENIGKRLKDLRLQKGLTQAEISDLVGLSRGHYSQLEMGKQFPSYQILSRFSKLYQKDYKWLLHGDIDKLNIQQANLRDHKLASNDSPPYQIPFVQCEDHISYLEHKDEQSYIDLLLKITISMPYELKTKFRAFQVEGNQNFAQIKDQDILIGELNTDKLRLVIFRSYIMVTSQRIAVLKILAFDTSKMAIKWHDGEVGTDKWINLNDVLEIWECKAKISTRASSQEQQSLNVNTVNLTLDKQRKINNERTL